MRICKFAFSAAKIRIFFGAPKKYYKFVLIGLVLFHPGFHLPRSWYHCAQTRLLQDLPSAEIKMGGVK